jgi:hypothetical protein
MEPISGPNRHRSQLLANGQRTRMTSIAAFTQSVTPRWIFTKTCSHTFATSMTQEGTRAQILQELEARIARAREDLACFNPEVDSAR